MEQIEQLKKALEKAEARAKRLMAQAEAAKVERDELETAIRVIERFASPEGSQALTSSQGDNGELIFSFVGLGKAEGRAPKEIIEALRAAGHDLGDDLIRTQLWRMAKRGDLKKSDGRYWRPVISKTEDDGTDDWGSVEDQRSNSNADWGAVPDAPPWGDTDRDHWTSGRDESPVDQPKSGFDLDDDIPF